MARHLVVPIVCVLSLTGTVLSLPAVTGAQSTQSGKSVLVSLRSENRDVRAVLTDLFKGSNQSYFIDPAVQGQITVWLNNVTFETALQNVLRQVDATYRIEGGVYMVIPRQVDEAPKVLPPLAVIDGTPFPGLPQEMMPPGGPVQMGAPQPPVLVQDNGYLYLLRGNVLLKISKKELKVEKTLELPPGGFQRRGMPRG